MKDRLYLKIINEQKEELENHLRMNGYNVTWISGDIIEMDSEEISYIQTILSDRNIELEEVTIELCPHCNSEVVISAERAVSCPHCEEIISPCSACLKTCDCCDCPY